MAAGRRSRKIIVERATVTENAFGEPVESWATFAQPFAEVIFGTAAEGREAAADMGSAAATFRVLHNSTTAAITVKDRVSFDGSYWNIAGNVPSLKLNRHREITATRRTD